MSEIRLCRDCKFLEGWKCCHPKNVRINLVTGAREYQDGPNYLRHGSLAGEGKCGEYGLWWERSTRSRNEMVK